MGTQRHCRSDRTARPHEFLDSVRSTRAHLYFVFDGPMVVSIAGALAHRKTLLITNALLLGVTR